jgi:TP901-1 family phage major tail protein
MAAQRGKDLLLKIRDATGSFVTVAGLRTRAMTFNAQAIDSTHADSGDRWRELLAGAGVRAAHVSGGGIFKDAASDALIRNAFFAGSVQAWQIIIPDFGRLEGPFQITTLSFAAQHETEVMFDLSLQSAGAISFTAL